jgi:hypothetical protein
MISRSEVLRRVLRHCGTRDVDVALAEELPLEAVRGARLQAGRNALDGTRQPKPQRSGPSAAPARRREPPVDFDGLMRSNVGVCT